MNTRTSHIFRLAVLLTGMAVAMVSCGKTDKKNKDSQPVEQQAGLQKGQQAELQEEQLEEQQKASLEGMRYDIAFDIPNTPCMLIADTAHEVYDDILIHNIEIVSPINKVLWSDTGYYYIDDEYHTNIPGICKTISTTEGKPADYIFITLHENSFQNYDTWLLHYDGTSITRAEWLCADTILDVNNDGVLDVVGRDLIEAVCVDCDSCYYNPYMVYSLGKELVENDTLEKQLAELIYGSYIGNRMSYTAFQCLKYDIDIFTLWRVKHDFNAIHYRDCHSAEYARDIKDHGAYRRNVRFADCTAYVCDGLSMYDNDSPFVLLYNHADSLVDYIWLLTYYFADANEDSVYIYGQSFSFDTVHATMQVDIHLQYCLLSSDTTGAVYADSTDMTHYYHLDSTGIHYMHSDTATHFDNAALYKSFYYIFNPARQHLND